MRVIFSLAPPSNAKYDWPKCGSDPRDEGHLAKVLPLPTPSFPLLFAENIGSHEMCHVVTCSYLCPDRLYMSPIGEEYAKEQLGGHGMQTNLL